MRGLKSSLQVRPGQQDQTLLFLIAQRRLRCSMRIGRYLFPRIIQCYARTGRGYSPTHRSLVRWMRHARSGHTFRWERQTEIKAMYPK